MVAFFLYCKTKEKSCCLVAYFKSALIRSMKKRKNKTLNSNKQHQKHKLVHEVSTTGDTKTNDFDLTNNKKPALSTIRTQIRKAQALIESGYTIPTRTEFDRLRIGVNLSLYGTQIEFKDVYLEEVANPKEPPSYIAENNKKWDLCNALKELDNISNKDKEFDDDNCIDNEIEDILFDEYLDENTTQTIIYEDNLNQYTTQKKRIYYDDYSRTIGLTNLFIDNGYFVVDISGKFMHGPGELGNLNKDNIREALQKIIDLKVVSFNIEKFIQHAQVFVCDICVDLKLDSLEQVYKYIEGISSFFPISTNRFKISKYGRHGLTLKPKSKHLGFFFIIYAKGQELNYSLKRNTKATRYASGIGAEGEALAKRTIRCEIKFYTLKVMRKWLGISNDTKGIIKLMDVLNSTQPIILKAFELFAGKAETLLKHIEWFNDLETTNNNLSLWEIFIAERFVEILRDNCFDIELTKNHIKTEYTGISDKELEHFNKLANLRIHSLNFLVYRKPKSITIMLAMLTMLQNYYSRGGDNAYAK